MELLPTAFLFRFAVPIPYAADLPHAIGWPIGDDFPGVPLFSALDRPGDDVTLRVVWNEGGIGIGVETHGKRKSPTARSGDLRGDGLTVWIDTRDVRGAHRASRYCHEFAIVPTLSSSRELRPRIAKREITMARENSAEITMTPPIRSALLDDGYRLEVWLPSEALHGFDPEQVPRIGFHAILTDRELGERPLTVGTEFATDRDPSLWTTLELTRQEVSQKPPASQGKPKTSRAPSRRRTSRKKRV